MESEPQENTPPVLTDTETRQQRLEQIFYELTGDMSSLSPHTVEYIERGDSLRLCLSELLELREKSQTEAELDTLRAAYVGTLFKKAGLLSRGKRDLYDAQSDWLQSEYVHAVVDEVAAIIDAQSPQEALAVGRVPSLVKQASFRDGEQLTLEDLAGNHLYILVDVALKEHILRRQMIDDHYAKSIYSRVASNRPFHVTVAGGIIAASLAPKFGIVPRPDEAATTDIELGLRSLSAAILAVDLPEIIRLKYLDIKHDKRTNNLHQKLAATKKLCDLALRLAYSSSRYGGADAADSVTGRSGTDDAGENIKRFIRLDKDFEHLNNDPGGKPYTGYQVLGYAARLLVEREDQLQAIIDPAKSAAERREVFLQLCCEILTEDVRRMKKGLNVTKLRRWVMGSIAVLPTVLVPAETAAVSDASTLGQGAIGIMRPKDKHNSDD